LVCDTVSNKRATFSTSENFAVLVTLGPLPAAPERKDAPNNFCRRRQGGVTLTSRRLRGYHDRERRRSLIAQFPRSMIAAARGYAMACSRAVVLMILTRLV